MHSNKDPARPKINREILNLFVLKNILICLLIPFWLCGRALWHAGSLLAVLGLFVTERGPLSC